MANPTKSDSNTGRKSKGSPSAKKKISVPSAGNVHIQATYNNTIVTITDAQGNALSWASAASCGFKGARKSTPFAAQQASTKAAQTVMAGGMKSVIVYVKGPGPGRESAIRALNLLGMTVMSIIDRTPITHNGCRAPKHRRI
jgi:small subunit ribosomal protein S11